MNFRRTKRFNILLQNLFLTLAAFIFLACDDAAVCGNGILEDGEACEPGITSGGSGCVEAGYWGGQAGCTATCRVDTEPCEKVVSIQQTGSNSCALSSSGHVYCWGSGEGGLNGDGAFELRLSPVSIPFGQVRIAQITINGMHACALDEDGWIACWGDNYLGQLGDGSQVDSASPRAVYRNTDLSFLEVASTFTGTCAIDEEGRLWRWGKLGEDDLGNEVISNVPVLVEEVSHLRFSHVYGYDGAYCAEAVDGRLWCWGKNDRHRLCGYDSEDALSLFEMLAPSGGRFVRVSMNMRGSCFLDEEGDGFCCGDEDEFGTAPMALEVPTDSGLVAVVFGMATMGIALDASGHATVWRAQSGELLLRYAEMVPAAVTATGVSWSAIGGCILDEKGYPWCNGYNSFGEVGVGHTNMVENMIRILPPENRD